MPQRVNDFAIARIEMSQSQFTALPQRVQEMLQTRGRQIPQGFGKPCIIEVPRYLVAELEAMMQQELAKKETVR